MSFLTDFVQFSYPVIFFIFISAAQNRNFRSETITDLSKPGNYGGRKISVSVININITRALQVLLFYFFSLHVRAVTNTFGCANICNWTPVFVVLVFIPPPVRRVFRRFNDFPSQYDILSPVSFWRFCWPPENPLNENLFVGRRARPNPRFSPFKTLGFRAPETPRPRRRFTRAVNNMTFYPVYRFSTIGRKFALSSSDNRLQRTSVFLFSL